MVTPRAFWNDVFQHNKAEWVADHPASYFFEIFERVGPFKEDFERATHVLDVGPGRGRLLEAHHGHRYAVEISDINTAALRERGVSVRRPGDDSLIAVDLAWSVSCFPHCDYDMQRTLLNQVYDALRPGGVFYLEHVRQKPGYPDIETDDLRLPSGRYWTDPHDVEKIWPGHMQDVIWREIGGPECPLLGWVARCVK